MFAVKLLLATPGLVGMAAFAGLSLSAHVPQAATHAVMPASLVARTMPVASVPDEAIGTTARPQTLFHRAPDGLFYVTARVNGVRVKFLIDTGATMVVLTKADAARVGAARHGAAMMMETASGPSAIDRVRLEHVAIAGRRVTAVDAAVVRRGLKVSLLGQDLLSRLGPVTISGNALELN